MEDTITVPTTITTVTITELKKYLVKGTVLEPRETTRSVKFFVVGRCTKNLGGYTNNSSKGLNAVLTRYTRGSAVKHTSASITR